LAAYQYDAFISYRHRPADMAVAQKLVQLLERMTGPEGKKLHIFRDREELPTETDLGSAIRKGLENSRFLIVVCSPSYKESRWCMEELRYFRQLHGNSNAFILPILVEGEPEDVFPEELCWEERTQLDKEGRAYTLRVELEPLGADVRAESHLRRMRLLRREYLRLAAPMLGKTFDQLYQRSRRRRRWTMGIFLSLVMAGLTAFTLYNMNMLRRIEQEHMTMLSNESRRLALEAESSLAEGDHSLAMLLALEALPQDLEDPERPLVSEAETALRSAVYSSLYARRKHFLQPLATLTFDEYGWNLTGIFDGGSRISVTDQEWLYLYDPATGMQLQRYPSNFFSEAHLNWDASLIAKCVATGEVDGLHRYRAELYSLKEQRELYREDYYIDAYNVYACWDPETNLCYFYELGDEADRIFFALDSTGKKITEFSLTPERWEQIKDSYWDFETDNRLKLPVETAYSARKDVWSPLGEKYRTYIEDLWKDSYREAVITEDEQLLIFYTVSPWERSGQSVIYALEPLKMGFKSPVTLEGSCRVDCANQRIYQFEEYALNIYSYRTENMVTAKMTGNNRLDELHMISSDGKRCMMTASMVVDDLHDISYEGADTAWVRIFLCEDLTSPLLELPHSGYYVTPELDYVFIKAETGVFELYHVEKGRILTLDMDRDRAAKVTNLCVSADGSLLAVAWREEGLVEVYSGTDGTLLRQIDVSAYDGMEEPTLVFLEFEGTDLLITLRDGYSAAASRIVDITGKREDICIDDGSFQRNTGECITVGTLTSDGLLFCSGDYLTGAVDAIYDVRTGDCVFRNVSYCQYDESRGLLLYVQTNPQYGDSAVLHAARRDEQGVFTDIYTVPLESGLNLRENLRCMDENYLILSGDRLCRVYEIESGRCVLNLHVPDAVGYVGRFYMAAGSIYDLKYHHSDTLTSYPLLDTAALAEMAREHLTSSFGQRQLTDGEKTDYFIE